MTWNEFKAYIEEKLTAKYTPEQLAILTINYIDLSFPTAETIMIEVIHETQLTIYD